jgi:hypothetical protein
MSYVYEHTLLRSELAKAQAYATYRLSCVASAARLMLPSITVGEGGPYVGSLSGHYIIEDGGSGTMGSFSVSTST